MLKILLTILDMIVNMIGRKSVHLRPANLSLWHMYDQLLTSALEMNRLVSNLDHNQVRIHSINIYEFVNRFRGGNLISISRQLGDSMELLNLAYLNTHAWLGLDQIVVNTPLVRLIQRKCILRFMILQTNLVTGSINFIVNMNQIHFIDNQADLNLQPILLHVLSNFMIWNPYS